MVEIVLARPAGVRLHGRLSSNVRPHDLHLFMNRRQALVTAALTVAGSSRGQPVIPQEGKQFVSLKTAQPVAPGKIEVLEFFSYACSHCFAFDPPLERWVSGLASDVAFRRVPVPFLRNQDNFQRTYFALEATGLVKQAHSKVFDAVHREGLALSQPAEIAEVVAKAGGSPDKFLSAFNSFSMPSFLARAKSSTATYEIEEVPTLAIGGRFLTTPGHAGGAAQALAVADYLIQRVRKQ